MVEKSIVVVDDAKEIAPATFGCRGDESYC